MMLHDAGRHARRFTRVAARQSGGTQRHRDHAVHPWRHASGGAVQRPVRPSRTQNRGFLRCPARPAGRRSRSSCSSCRNVRERLDRMGIVRHCRSHTNVPQPVRDSTRPSRCSAVSAFLAVTGATPNSPDRAMIDGTFRPGGYAPDAIRCRSTSAICCHGGTTESRVTMAETIGCRNLLKRAAVYYSALLYVVV